MRYFIGLIGFPTGLLVVIYREKIKRFTGDLPFAERWFGVGGTYTAFAILGLVISIGSIMYAFGTLQMLFSAVLGPIFGTASLE